MMGQIAAAIDPRGQLDLIFRTLGLARHLVVACIMLALALLWEMLKALGRGAGANGQSRRASIASGCVGTGRFARRERRVMGRLADYQWATERNTA